MSCVFVCLSLDLLSRLLLLQSELFVLSPLSGTSRGAQTADVETSSSAVGKYPANCLFRCLLLDPLNRLLREALFLFSVAIQER